MPVIKNTFAHCYHCNKTFTEIPETRYARGGRLVAFCSSKCFKAYILSNFIPKCFSPVEKKPVVERLDSVMTELKTDCLFLPDSSPQKIVNEEVIWFLTFIKEGREIVTRHERAAVMARV